MIGAPKGRIRVGVPKGAPIGSIGVGSSGPGLSAEVSAYFGAMAVQPSAPYAAMLTTFIDALVAGGVFAKGIAGYFGAAETDQAAFINFFDPTGTPASKDGTITRTSGQGWRSGGGWVQGDVLVSTTAWAQDSAAIASIQMDVTELDSSVVMGDRVYSTGQARHDGWSIMRLNSGASLFPTNSGGPAGVMLSNRVASGTIRCFVGNDARQDIASVSVDSYTSGTNEFLIGGASAETSPEAVALAMWMQGLTSGEETACLAAMNDLYSALLAL